MELCPICGEEFETGELRGAHMREEHEREVADLLESAARRAYEKSRPQ